MTYNYTLDGDKICMHDGKIDFCGSLIVGGCNICNLCDSHNVERVRPRQRYR